MEENKKEEEEMWTNWKRRAAKSGISTWIEEEAGEIWQEEMGQGKGKA